jgi:hypothetical protein
MGERFFLHLKLLTLNVEVRLKHVLLKYNSP